jgi:hypothetical protein
MRGNFTKEEAKQLVAKADKNNDGRINIAGKNAFNQIFFLLYIFVF